MKRSVNRALSLILTLAMSLTLFPAAAFAREETPAEGEAPLAETQLAPLEDQAPNAALLYAAEAADYAETVLKSDYGASDNGSVQTELDAVKTLLEEGTADETTVDAAADALLVAVAELTREEKTTVAYNDSKVQFVPGIGVKDHFEWYENPGKWYQLDYKSIPPTPDSKPSDETNPVSVTYTYTGTRFEYLVLNRGSNYHAIGEVYLGEDMIGTFNSKNGGTGFGDVVFASERLEQGEHTVTLKFTDTEAEDNKGTAYFAGFNIYQTVPILYKTTLVRAIAGAAKALADDPSADNAAAVEAAIDSARRVLNNVDADREAVDRAVKGLTAALDPDDPSVEQAVVRLGSLKRIYVEKGTEAGVIPFPETVTAYLDIGGPVELPLGEFTSEDYQANQAGVYTFEAPVQASRTVSVPSNLKAALTVQVGWDGFDDLRARWYEYLIGTEDCWTAEYIASVDARVDAFIDRFIPLEAGAATDTRKYVFSDYEAVSGSQGNNHARTNQTALSYDRVKSLAIAVKTPGSKYNTQYWADQVVAAMAVLSKSYTRVGSKGHAFSSNIPYGSGYDWAMGTPQRYIDLLTIMWDELAADTGVYKVRTVTDGPEDTEVTLLEKYMGDLAWHNAAPLSNESGANRTWLACARMTLGALEKNEDKIKEAIAGMRPEVTPSTSGEGFYADGSFLQHGGGAFAYTGGYGKGLLVTLSGAMWMFHDSEYPIEYEDDAEEFFYDMIFEAYEPLIVNGLFMDMSREREITRPTNPDDLVGAQILRSIAHMSQVMPEPWGSRAKSLVKEYLQIPEVKTAVYTDSLFPSAEESKPWFNEYIMPGSVVGICEDILADEDVQPRGDLDVTKIYTNMARIAHQKPGWGFSASMHSDKVKTYEVVNSEGSNRWHVGDGMTYVYTSDTQQYNGDYYAALDMQRLAGTTVERVNNLNNEAVSTGNSSKNNAYAWAGGSSLDDQYGVGGMMLKGGDGTGGRTADSVDARKSWFMFDDEVVAVGSGITSNTGKTVETVIDNRKLLKNMDENVLTIDGEVTTDGTHENASWMHLTGNTLEKGSDIGWYFPTGENVSTLKESRTGTWNRLNQYFKFKDEAENTNRTNNYATLWIDHGAKPTGADYAYVILPGKDQAATAAYAQSADIEILAMTPEVHAVRENTLDITGYNFWAAGTCEGVTVSAPASVMVRELDETLELDEALQISVADPTRKLSTITVTLDQPTGNIVEENEKIRVAAGRNQTVLEVDVKGAAGKSFEIVLAKGDSELDVTAPTPPADLSVSALTDTSVTLVWTAVADKDRLTYQVYQKGEKVETTTGLSYTAEGLTPGTAYDFSVKAVDPSENESIPSSTLTVTTLTSAQMPKPEEILCESFDDMNLGEVASQNGWSLGKTGAGQTNVIANPKGDGQSLLVSSADSGNNRERNADYIFSVPLTGAFDLSCKVYFEPGKSCNDAGLHLLNQNDTAAASMMMFADSFGYRQGSDGKTTTGIAAGAGTWYTVNMHVNVGEQTFDLMVDGDTNTAKIGLAFRNGTAAQITKLRIGTPNSATGQIIVDDVLITVPSDKPVPEMVSAVTASPAAGGYTGAQSVTLTTATQGAVIHYTTDGSAPTAESATYENPISVAASTVVKAVAVKDGLLDSPVSAFPYTIDSNWGKKTVASVAEQTPITVPYGTAETALRLPSEVKVTMSDGTSRWMGVAWTCAAYAPDTAGDYVFTGALDRTGHDDVLETSVTARITITVEPKPAADPDVNIAPKAVKVESSSDYNSSYSAKLAVDGKLDTRWASAANKTAYTLALTFDAPQSVYKAGINSYDSRITTFAIEYFADGAWVSAYEGGAVPGVTNGSTAANTSYCSFAPHTSDQWRLNIKSWTKEPTIWEFELYAANGDLTMLSGAVPAAPITSAGGDVTLNLTGMNLEEADIEAKVGGETYPATVTSATTATVTVKLPANPSERDKTHKVSFTLNGQPAGLTVDLIVPAGVEVAHKLWLQYDSPAPADGIDKYGNTSTGYKNWQNWTLPIGNGYSGATLYGQVDRELMQVSEESLWTGGMVSEGGEATYSDAAAIGLRGRDGSDITSSAPYKNARDLALGKAGDTTPPDNQAINDALKPLFMDKNSNPGPGREALGSYQNFTEVFYDFKHEGKTITAAETEDYLRWLDIENAVTGTSYSYEGVNYTRESFASYPDRVIVTKLTADQDGKVAFTLNPTVPHADLKKNISITADAAAKTISLSGALKQNGLRFAAKFQVITDGTVTAGTKDGNGILTVTGAREAVVVMSLGTDYANDYAARYRTGADPMIAVADRLVKAAAKGYDALRATHVADYRKIFDRVELDLGGAANNDTTDALLSAYKAGKSITAQRPAKLRYLEELYFQYGRYLLISSSREGTLPANLQGVWNRESKPMWQSDYHLNINLQMNYWPANNTNMKETLYALVDYMDSLRAPGRKVASAVYGVGDGVSESGWVAHVSSNPFGFTGFYNWHDPDNNAGHSQYSPESAMWMMQNIYDMYQYYPDEAYLRDRIYPIMKEAALFYSNEEILVADPASGRMVMSPTFSSEQGPMWGGDTFQQQLLWQLFTDVIDAAETLNVDDDLVAKLNALLPKLSAEGDDGPVPIGDTIGAGNTPGVKEWWWETGYQQTAAGKVPDVESDHRHLSHLVGLYPGSLITKDTQAWMDAAIASLNRRGDAATGWSRGMKTNLWARTGDGNHAYKIFDGLISSATLNNLWDFHEGPYFQIDGNLGAAAGMVEMLMQSHAGYIEPLPALPDAWPSGSVSGITMQGGFTADMTWADKTVTRLVLTSTAGQDCSIKYPGATGAVLVTRDGQPVETTAENGVTTFATAKGGVYAVSFNGEQPTHVPVTGVSLDRETLTLEIGRTGALTAAVAPTTATDRAVTWTTSNAGIATVADGVVTAVAQGTASITVTTADGGKTASCTVTVTGASDPGPSGSSSTGSGAPAVNATKPETADGTTTVTVEKKAAVTDGSAEAAFTDSDLKKAADSAVKAAEEAGTTPELKLQLKTSGAVNAASASLPTATLKDMLEAHEDFSLTVSSAVGSVTLDGTALSGVLAGADGKTVTLTVCTVEQPELTAGQLPLAGDRPVVDVQITGGALAGGSAMVVLPYALADDETADDLVIWHVDDAGKLEAIPCTYADGFVRFVTAHFSRFVIGSFPFDDVAPGTWYYGDAVYAYQTGLLAGTGDRAFSPETVTTRGMLVTMLWRQAGSPKEAEAPFRDVPADAWYAQAVAWAARSRIVNGYDETRFGPDDPITREQMAVILRNYARTRGADTTGGSLEGFTDSAAVSNWAAEAVGWAVERGLMNGVGGDTLAPGGSADRAQTAAMLRRLLSMA